MTNWFSAAHLQQVMVVVRKLHLTLRVRMGTQFVVASREREREISLFLCGYRYALQDQDTTWLAAC